MTTELKERYVVVGSGSESNAGLGGEQSQFSSTVKNFLVNLNFGLRSNLQI